MKSFTDRLYEHYEDVHREFASKAKSGGSYVKAEPTMAIEAVGRLLDEIAADAGVMGKLKERNK